MENYHEVIEGKVSRGTGAKKEKFRDKRKAHIGRPPIKTRVGKEERKVVRVRGGNKKVKVKKAEFINVVVDGKTVKARIVRVIEGNNPDFTRQNIITKGALVEVEGLGKARVTSRPGQDGVINGVLVKE